jgi:hypothetical protein
MGLGLNVVDRSIFVLYPGTELEGKQKILGGRSGGRSRRGRWCAWRGKHPALKLLPGHRRHGLAWFRTSEDAGEGTASAALLAWHVNRHCAVWILGGASAP